MKKLEAEELKKLIDSFVEEDSPPKGTGKLPGLEEGEVIAPPIEPVKELTEEEIKKMFRGSVPEGFDQTKAEAVRSPLTGDRVFLKFGEERRWIPDTETLDKLGITMGDVKNITDDEMRALKEGFGLFSAKLW